MTNLQKILLRLSEVRERLNEIAGLEGDDLTEEIRGEADALQTEYRDLETRQRAAIVADEGEQREAQAAFAGDDPEAREMRQLITRCDVGRIFESVLEKRATEGAEAELQQHHGLASNQVPLALLETRAVTAAPANTARAEQEVVQPVFSEGDAAFLSVDMPRVPAGDAVFPVLTTRPDVHGPHADSTAAAETDGAFEAESLSPGRLQASFFYRRTDAARFRGMGDALRMALNAGLTEALDKEMIDQIVADVARTNAGGVNTFATYRQNLVYGRVDGRFASTEGDVRIIVGSKTLEHMSGAYRSNNADDSAVDSIRRVSGGLRVSPHIAAAAANKQDTIVRLGMRRDAVAPMWDGVSLIPDEVTKAATGEIVITAVLMAAFKVLRAGAFARIQTQHA